MIKKFAAQATANPTRFYRAPREVLQDRRLTRDEKMAILEAWEREASEAGSDDHPDSGEPTILDEVLEAQSQLGSDEIGIDRG